MTATGRKVASKIVVGDRVQVERHGDRLAVTRKVREGVEVATVTAVDNTLVRGTGRKAQRRYTIETDLGSLGNLAPAETVGIAPAAKAPTAKAATVATRKAGLDNLAANTSGKRVAIKDDRATARQPKAPTANEDTSAEFAALTAIPLSDLTPAQQRRIKVLANRIENTGEGQAKATKAAATKATAKAPSAPAKASAKKAPAKATTPKAPRAPGRLSQHIAAAFNRKPKGTFLSLAEIAAFASEAYPADGPRPSSGTLNKALHLSTCPAGVTPAKGGPKNVGGAVKS